MAKQKTPIINVNDAISRIDNWKNGINTMFKCGDVVERKAGEIGVITILLCECEQYRVKWYKGPNPWDFIEGKTNGYELKLSKKPNPLKYTNAQRYPGPAANQIKKLNEVFNKDIDKPKTGKDVDKYIQILEEEIIRNKDNKKVSDDIDSVVDETLEEDSSAATIIDSVDIKRKNIIEEE